MKKTWIELDGAQGGGQILRTALTLSAITGKAFRINRIRARRERPGLLRQHLTAVEAARAVCGAEVHGDTPGSQTLSFVPGAIRSGDYRFSIGTAGSCTLVLQTIMPMLWFAPEPSQLLVSGGTHNPMAPPVDFLIRAWLPLLRRMGVKAELTLERHGFYPAGGGRVRAVIQPCAALSPLRLTAPGDVTSLAADARVAAVPLSVAERELACLQRHFPNITVNAKELPVSEGPGNVLLVDIRRAAVTEVLAGIGEKRVRAEQVAERLAHTVREYLQSGAAVGEYLADQLVLPMALAGGGEFTLSTASDHLRSNLAVIGQFLPMDMTLEPLGDSCWSLCLEGAPVQCSA